MPKPMTFEDLRPGDIVTWHQSAEMVISIVRPGPTGGSVTIVFQVLWGKSRMGRIIYDCHFAKNAYITSIVYRDEKKINIEFFDKNETFLVCPRCHEKLSASLTDCDYYNCRHCDSAYSGWYLRTNV